MAISTCPEGFSKYRNCHPEKFRNLTAKIQVCIRPQESGNVDLTPSQISQFEISILPLFTHRPEKIGIGWRLIHTPGKESDDQSDDRTEEKRQQKRTPFADLPARGNNGNQRTQKQIQKKHFHDNKTFSTNIGHHYANG